MKGNIQLEISTDELRYELQSFIEKIAKGEVTRLVAETAKSLVEVEVKKIIAPIVDKHLETALVGRDYEYHEWGQITKRPIDDFIVTVLKKYLDEPVYHYSKNSNELSKKYMPSSRGGEKKTRAEQWVTSKAQEYVDTQLFPEMEQEMNEIIAKIVPNKDQIQEIIKAEIRRMVENGESK